KQETLDKILADGETMMKSAKKYKVASNKIEEDSGTNDLLSNSKIKKAWEAFVKKVKDAITAYKASMGIEETKDSKAKEKAKS
ncbi:MAG: hypothetical protein AAFQ78_02230, partial [Bacteroidota bacterium]